uniref:2'-5' oligoadenylate synthase n=1 Tax=Peromyscus maniculatus bairdii TaxID=230844 RepID=A0A8C8URH2_PERMB
MAQKLSSTPARELDKFIEDNLLPDTRFRIEVKEAIDIIWLTSIPLCMCRLSLSIQCPGWWPPRLLRVCLDCWARFCLSLVILIVVFQGGSSGKGTALKGRSDADLVVFLTKLTSFEDQLNRRGEFIQEIKEQLYELQRKRPTGVRFEIQSSPWPNPRVLSFKLSSPQLQQEVEFDVLPAYDVLVRHYRKSCIYGKPDPEIYRRLIRECTYKNLEGEFSTCFTELQRNFLKHRPTKLKSLIRLVKHWYQLCKEKLGKPLPAQYALELLTVYAWECGSGALEFKTAQGFQTVLELVINYRELQIYWTEYYDFEDQYISNYLHRQLRRARPVILDPADPTGNVAGGNPEAWRRLAGEALAWLDYPCFRNWDGSRVRSWEVPCVFFVSGGG